MSWPRDGVPSNPAGWLLTVGKRRAIDAFRRRAARDDRYSAIARDLGDGTTDSVAEIAGDPDHIDDDVLALIFISCHPLLSPEARVALTLRVVGGLTSDEIARAFLTPTATIQARITRAKKSLAAAGVRFEIPEAHERRERLGSVLSVIYLVFTEGSTATSGEALIRTDLAREAVRLARVLARLVPDDNEVLGLLALLELTSSRFAARTDADGESVLLADQDRRRWDLAAIRRGRAALAQATGLEGGLGAYGLQAAIAECHAVARSVDDTDWERIVALYAGLGTLTKSPIVELNRAVAVSMARGPAEALEIVDLLVTDERLAATHLLPSVRGELLARLGRVDEARGELECALRLCGNAREQAVLERKLRTLV